MSLQPRQHSTASAPDAELRGLRSAPEMGAQERGEAEPGTGTRTGREREVTPRCRIYQVFTLGEMTPAPADG